MLAQFRAEAEVPLTLNAFTDKPVCSGRQKGGRNRDFVAGPGSAKHQTTQRVHHPEAAGLLTGRAKHLKAVRLLAPRVACKITVGVETDPHVPGEHHAVVGSLVARVLQRE